MGGDTKAPAGGGAVGMVSIAGGDSWVGILPSLSFFHWYWPVSIAGGDSWVGIQGTLDGVRVPPLVSIAGGDSWVGIRPKPGG